MTDFTLIIIYSLLSGSTIFLGGLLSHYFGDHFRSGLIKAEIVHLSIAFGGGILMAAVGLVLVPQGMEVLPWLPIILCFSAGTVCFFFFDRYLEKNNGTMAQLLGMLLDFVPEATALGAVFILNPKLGILLALIIGFQNFPEAFNAYMDLKASYSPRICLLILFMLSFAGVPSALVGYYLLADKPMAVGGLMLFSAGGLIYLVFQDIAPMSKLNKNWIPAIGASVGFLFGMLGVKLLA